MKYLVSPCTFFYAAHETSALNVEAFFFFKFLTEECILRVKKTKMTCRNMFNGEHFDIDGNHGLNKDQKFFF